MHAVAYLRCSGEAQIVGDTWARQTAAINALAKARGFTIIREWREEGVSGKVECDQRPAFQDMLATLLANGCRTIIIEDLSRLARRYAVQEQILLYLCAKEITLWTCANGGENITEAMNADPTRRLVIGMIGLISQWEREQIVAKLRAARQRKRALNGKCEGRHAYGHTADERAVLDRMSELKSEGFTNQKIALYLNDAGMKTRYGRLWHAATVSKILSRQEVA